MILLAIETSTPLTSVALHTPQGISVREDNSTQHKASDVVMALIDELLQAQDVQRPQLQAVAYGSGPGGFTGLRTACAVAQGIAFGLQLPTIGITSLQALAEQAYLLHQHTQVMALMDARMQEVYAQALRRDANGVWHEAQAMAVSPVQDIAWPRSDGGWHGAGNAWHCDDLKAAIQAATPPHVQAPASACVPHARYVALLAARCATPLPAKPSLAQMLAEPSYVRDRVAQTTAERMVAKAAQSELASLKAVTT